MSGHAAARSIGHKAALRTGGWLGYFPHPGDWEMPGQEAHWREVCRQPQ